MLPLIIVKKEMKMKTKKNTKKKMDLWTLKKECEKLWTAGNNLCEESRDYLESDLTEKRLVDDFTTIGCGCEKGPNKSLCSLQFDRDYSLCLLSRTFSQ